jgi:hypothetical protein
VARAAATWNVGFADCDLTGTNRVRPACAQVDAAFLPALRIRPIIGRYFTPEEDRPNARRHPTGHLQFPAPGGLARSMIYAAIEVRGRPSFRNGTAGMVTWRSVTTGYFAALGIPILRGRGFQEEDRDPNRNTVILSDALARRMFPGEVPLGWQIQPAKPPGCVLPCQVR